MLTEPKISIKNELFKSIMAVLLSVSLTYIISTFLFDIPFTKIALLSSIIIPLLILPLFIIPNYKQKKKVIKTNRLLVKMVDEKNLLIHEVHHRVKNNLSIVLSLLHLQNQRPLYKTDLEYSRLNFERRIQTMSLVYDLILRSSNLATMNLRDFLLEQRDFIIDLIKNPYIHIDLITEPGNLTVSFANAIPIGLIISEICINAYQHAFPNRNKGKIRIKAISTGASTTLTIEDDGIGIPSNVSSGSTDTIGLNLVTALSDQVKGKYDIKNNNGTIFTLVYNN